ncbi:MAG: hypothetical protein R6T87_06125 [Marinobacter sp.]
MATFRVRMCADLHAIWHLFVIGGSVCHFSAVYFDVLPYTV